jgi:hypothetical protein
MRDKTKQAHASVNKLPLTYRINLANKSGDVCLEFSKLLP